MSKSQSHSSGNTGLQPDGSLHIPIDKLIRAMQQLMFERRSNPLLDGQDLFLLATRQALGNPQFNWTHTSQRQAVKHALYTAIYSTATETTFKELK